MNFKFNINLNEKDYLNMNVFWSFKSPYGKKEIIKMRLWIAAICLVGAFFSALREKLLLWSIVGMIPYFIILVIFQFLLKPFWIMILKANIKSMKKKGKLPFSAASEIEFFDEIFIEKIEELNEKMNIPSSIPEINDADIQELAKTAEHEANPLYPVPVLYTTEELENLYKKIKNGN